MWTDQRETRLRELWADGVAASLIAAELNREDGKRLGFLTRNAVIGKVHRMGLHEGAGARTRVAPKKTAAPVQKKPWRPANGPHGNGHSRMATLPAPAAPPPPELTMRCMPLLDLTFKDGYPVECRWPIEALFCGADVVEGKSYCPYHCGVAYNGVSR